MQRNFSIRLEWQYLAVLLIVAFLLGLMLAEGSGTKNSGTKSSTAIREKEIIRARPDTVRSIVEVPMRSLHARANANGARVIVQHDTVFRQACLDTLLATDTAAVAPDTLSVCYAQNMFTLSLELAARRATVSVPYLARDTFYWRDDSIRVETASGRAWYSDALTLLAAIAAGIIIGKL